MRLGVSGERARLRRAVEIAAAAGNAAASEAPGAVAADPAASIVTLLVGPVSALSAAEREQVCWGTLLH